MRYLPQREVDSLSQVRSQGRGRKRSDWQLVEEKIITITDTVYRLFQKVQTTHPKPVITYLLMDDHTLCSV